MLVQSVLERVHRLSLHYAGRESVPVFYDPVAKVVSPDTLVRPWVLQLVPVSSCCCHLRVTEKLLLGQSDAVAHDLVGGDHITSPSSVQKRWEVKLTQSFLIAQVPQLRLETGSSTLYPFYK